MIGKEFAFVYLDSISRSELKIHNLVTNYILQMQKPSFLIHQVPLEGKHTHTETYLWGQCFLIWLWKVT